MRPSKKHPARLSPDIEWREKMKPVIDYLGLVGDLRRQLHAVSAQFPSEGFPKSLRHMIDLRVSQINGCLFCQDLHTKELLADGRSSDRIQAIATWRTSESFDAAERSALDWAELLTRGGVGKASLDKGIDSLRPYFDEESICRLTFTIALKNAWNRIAIAFYRHD